MKTAARRRSFRFFLLVEVLILFAGAASANKGFLNFSVWNRSLLYRNQTFGLPNSTETIFHLDFSQDITNFGTITAWTDGLLSGGNGRFSRGLVTWTGLKIGGFTFDFEGGDDYFSNTNLESRFINLYHPYIYFRGGSAGLTSRAFDLAVYGGKIARLTGLLGNTYDILDQPFYGLKSRMKFGNALILGGGYFRTENQKDWAGLVTADRNDLILADSEITFAPGWKLLGEFRRSRADGPSSGQTSGNSYRFGPLIHSGRLSFEANYRFTGSRFQDLTPESQAFRDERGIFSSLRFQLSRSLAVFGIVDRSNNNVDGDPSRNVNNALFITSGFSLYSPSFLDLTAQWEYEQRKSEKELPYAVDSLSQGVFIQASKTWGRFFPYVRFRWQRSEDRMVPSMTSTRPTLFVGFRQGLASGSFFWLEGEWNQKRNASRHEIDRNINLRSGVNYVFSSKFNIYAELFYHRYGTQNLLQQIEAFLSLNINLFRDTTLSIDVRALEPLNRKNQPSNYTFTLRLNKRFSWGAPPRILGRYGLGEGPIGLGAIEGYVFEDRNRTGLMETGEKALAGIAVRLEDGSTVVTNDEGKYRFSNVAEGPHQIQIDDRSIPATYYLLSPTQVNVLVEPRVTNQIPFLMISGATLSGRFVEDVNRNGTIDKDDKGLADVLVILNPVKKEGQKPEMRLIQDLILNTFTGPDGAYVFDNIPPGEYELSLDEDTLPKGAKTAVPMPVLVRLKAGETIEGADYLVTPRPVVIREFK